MIRLKEHTVDATCHSTFKTHFSLTLAPSQKKGRTFCLSEGGRTSILSVKPIIPIMSLQRFHVHGVFCQERIKFFYNYLVAVQRSGKNKITAAGSEPPRSGLTFSRTALKELHRPTGRSWIRPRSAFCDAYKTGAAALMLNVAPRATRRGVYTPLDMFRC